MVSNSARASRSLTRPAARFTWINCSSETARGTMNRCGEAADDDEFDTTGGECAQQRRVIRCHGRRRAAACAAWTSVMKACNFCSRSSGVSFNFSRISVRSASFLYASMTGSGASDTPTIVRDTSFATFSNVPPPRPQSLTLVGPHHRPHGAVLARTTSVCGSVTCSGAPLPPLRMSSSTRTAFSPICRIGCATVVSGGSV